jgi:hypothetical protein
VNQLLCQHKVFTVVGKFVRQKMPKRCVVAGCSNIGDKEKEILLVRDISGPSEQLVTRIFLTRLQNSIWHLTRSGNILLLFLLYSLKYFFLINTRHVSYKYTPGILFLSEKTLTRIRIFLSHGV